jgi:tetratricopeptide (TPR) repeat protein
MMNSPFCQRVLLTSVLLCLSLPAVADDVQDANKLFKQGQYAPALDKVNSFLASKPKDAQARFLKGLILTEQGKASDAIKVFAVLTDDYPELPEPYNNLAVLYAGQGQYEKAKIALEMAIRTHPSYATAHENLGDIYAKMASQAYDRALQLDRSNTETQTKLAMIKDLFGGNPKGSKNPVLVAANTPPSKPVEAAKVVESAAANNVAVVSKPSVPATKPTVGSSDPLKTVQAWAAAWSAKDSDKYLAFYAHNFATPDGSTRADWEALRRERIAKPATIQVTINKPKLHPVDSTHTSVSFKQSYRASHLNTASGKTLLLVKVSGKWLIQEERAGK